MSTEVTLNEVIRCATPEITTTDEREPYKAYNIRYQPGIKIFSLVEATALNIEMHNTIEQPAMMLWDLHILAKQVSQIDGEIDGERELGRLQEDIAGAADKSRQFEIFWDFASEFERFGYYVPDVYYLDGKIDSLNTPEVEEIKSTLHSIFHLNNTNYCHILTMLDGLRERYKIPLNYSHKVGEFWHIVISTKARQKLIEKLGGGRDTKEWLEQIVIPQLDDMLYTPKEIVALAIILKRHDKLKHSISFNKWSHFFQGEILRCRIYTYKPNDVKPELKKLKKLKEKFRL